MSGDLGVAIEVDTSQVLPALSQVKGGLRDTQAEMERLKANVAQGLAPAAQAFGKLASAIEQERAALQRAAAIHEQFAVTNSALVRSMGGVATAIQREQQMLDAIHGPMQRYEQDLQTLDSLMTKGKISTEQYAEQVTKLNQRIGERPEEIGPMYGPIQQTPNAAQGGLSNLLGTGGLGLSGGALAGGGIVGGIAVFGQLESTLDSVIQKYQQASDAATEFQNHAMKFVDGGHDVNKVLADQQQLAHDLHAPLQSTMDLYDAIGDATSELNLSERQLLAITKNVGEATTIANKPLASAGDLIGRIAVAFEAGADSSRAIRQLMVQYKDLGDIWTSAFNTSKSGLLEMVRDHKIGLEQMTLALATNTASTQAAFALRHRTYSDERQELKDLAATFEQQGQSELEAMASAQLKFEQLDAAVKPLSERFALLRDNIASMTDTLGKSTTMLQTWTQVAVSYGVANDAEIKIANTYAGSIRIARNELEGLNKARRDGLIGDVAYRKEWENLITTIDGRLPAVYTEIHKLHDPMVEAQRDQDAITKLWKEGKVSIEEYADEIERTRQILDKYKDVRPASVGVGITPANMNELASDKAGDLYRGQIASAVDDDQRKADFDRGMKALEQSGKNSADAVGNAWKSALDQVNKSIIDLVTTGTASFGDLASAIEKIVVQMALSGLEGGIGSALRGGGGAQQGNEALAAGAIGQLLPMLFAYGGDVSVGSRGLSRLPHAAYGADFMVGGVGGFDTRLAQLAVSPGELISVRTPQQQVEEARKGVQASGPNRVVNHYNMMYDRRAIISNKDDDERILAAYRRNRSAFRSMSRAA